MQFFECLQVIVPYQTTKTEGVNTLTWSASIRPATPTPWVNLTHVSTACWENIKNFKTADFTSKGLIYSK